MTTSFGVMYSSYIDAPSMVVHFLQSQQANQDQCGDADQRDGSGEDDEPNVIRNESDDDCYDNLVAPTSSDEEDSSELNKNTRNKVAPPRKKRLFRNCDPRIQYMRY
jgi:hypothetical protein